MASHQWRDYFRRNRLPAHFCSTYGCGVVAYSIFDNKSMNRLDRYHVVTATLTALFLFPSPRVRICHVGVLTRANVRHDAHQHPKNNQKTKRRQRKISEHAPTEDCDIMMVYVCAPATKNTSVDLSRQNLNVTTMGSTAQVPKTVSSRTTSNVIRPRREKHP